MRGGSSSAQPAEVRIELAPALEARAFLEALFQMVEDGQTEGGRRIPVRLAVLAQRYHREVPAEGNPLAKLPAPVLRGLVRVMALAGRGSAGRRSPDDRDSMGPVRRAAS
jgi:hypothetical protein